MISYGICILPLIRNLKNELPDVTHRYAGDLGMFARIETYFNSITHQVPGRGYYPETSKSVMIVHPENLEAGELIGARHEFKVFTGAYYLGGYIGDDKYKHD